MTKLRNYKYIQSSCIHVSYMEINVISSHQVASFCIIVIAIVSYKYFILCLYISW